MVFCVYSSLFVKLLKSVASVQPRNKIQAPADSKVKRLIDHLARYVAQYGHIFEKAVMSKEINNPKFFFLYQVLADFFFSERNSLTTATAGAHATALLLQMASVFIQSGRLRN